MAAEITATTKRDPGQIYEDLTHDLGRSYYERIDAPATRKEMGVLRGLSADRIAATELAGEPIESKLTAAPGNGEPFGGVKVTAKEGWFAARPSGTEDVYKIYAESFRSEDHLRRIQQEAQSMIAALISAQESDASKT
jgi:phosphoglucomutase